MSSQESAYGTGFASSMAVAAPDEVFGWNVQMSSWKNSNCAATKAVEIAADKGPRPGHIPHAVRGAEGGGADAGGGAGASANNQSIPISATALTNQTAEPTATALATGVHCTGPSFTKFFESGLKTSNLQGFLRVRARGGGE
jgi:hypothetical protein